MAKPDAQVIDRLIRDAAEALETDGVNRIGLRCLCCKDRAWFLQGDLRTFFDVYFGKECTLGGRLMFLTTE